MQPTWGPRIFWLLVFLLAVAGVFAYFYEPPPELGRPGHVGVLDNVLTISPKFTGFELQLAGQAPGSTDWSGSVALSTGKVVQIHPTSGVSNWTLKGNQFQFVTQPGDRGRGPAVVHVVAEVEGEASLTIALKEDKQTLALADLASGKVIELFGGKARLRRVSPVQAYSHDGMTDDIAPTLATDKAGNAHLLYLRCAKTKGIDVDAVVSGSFDSLDRPIMGASIRLCHYAQGNWQYSETVADKLETILDPVAAIDPTNRVFVAWSQQGPEGWDVFYSSKELSGKGDAVFTWSTPVKLTEKPGTHQRLAAVTDSKGKVWLAWQAWHHGHFDIYAAVLNDRQHAWAKPGPVAEHSREEEGRWHPALAADAQGNVFVAWSVFRSGHFDIGLARLNDNSVAAKPTYVAASAHQEQRPALRCDAENNLWVAYEELEASEGISFATPSLTPAKVRVRIVRPDLGVEELPPLPRPIRVNGAKDAGETPSCQRPSLVHTKSGGLVVSYESQHRLYLTRLQNDGWSEPEEFVTLPADLGARPVVAYLDGQVCALFEGADPAGHARLCLATRTEPSQPAPTTKRTTVAAESLTLHESADWKRFVENARLFRKRPEELVNHNRYLLRGLFLSGRAARAGGGDGFDFAATAFEQGMYDWILLSKSAIAPPAASWRTGERALAFTQQGERPVLTGFLRPLAGQREPIFVVDNKQLNAPLPTLSRLEELKQAKGRTESPVGSQATDTKMLAQFVSQTQGAGFLLTEDWRLFGTMNKPTQTSAFLDADDQALIPFWYPATEPGRPVPLGVRVVTFARGKSYDDLVTALRERNFYIATDDIHLLARCDRRMPGEIFQTAFRPKINVVAQGVSKLARVEIWQDSNLVMSEEPAGAASVLEYENKNADNAWHSYTVRVLQANGAMAISQPFWIRYQP